MEKETLKIYMLYRIMLYVNILFFIIIYLPITDKEAVIVPIIMTAFMIIKLKDKEERQVEEWMKNKETE